QFGIYSALGQLYEPEDHEELLYYREAKDGQILEEGITEAGALSSWLAAATSYSSHGTPMLPFYIYYSIFGFQRVGDLIWAAADSRARGFLVGGTAGNENYPHPATPEGAEEGILKGMYQIKKAENSKLQLLGSGAILREVIAAAELLDKDWGIQAAVWSVTSFTELRRDGMRAER